MKEKSKLSLEPYKGTRDFYPEDQFVQEYMFSVMRRVVERYGYEPYHASVLEDAALYRAKSGDEIVSEQTYTFKDRGEREVTLRPEMTPTLARMVAKRRQELAFPLRWYSIPNMFRYERPQRGRLREHWQLNADIFGVEGIEAETELIAMARDLMREFGAKDSGFEIRVNASSGKLAKVLQSELDIDAAAAKALVRLVDKKEKISASEFRKAAEEILGAEAAKLLKLLSSAEPFGEDLEALLQALKKRGVENARFYPSLVRGFEYYTGIIFEVFDTNKENPRALFGGGRYDELLDIFGVAPVPAAGFGMGDVTMRDYLETHKLLPAYSPKTMIYLCRIGEEAAEYAEEVAGYLREQGIPVALDYTGRKVGLQVKSASKQSVPFVIVIGEEEMHSHILSFKEMGSGKESKLTKEKIAEHVKKSK